MLLPTEPIGSIPRPKALIDAINVCGSGSDPSLESLYDAAVRDTIERFAATRSPVISDGEQRKYRNFWTYSIDSLPNTLPDGFKIPLAAGRGRRMPRLTEGPFRYAESADRHLGHAMRFARVPLKQAVISPSAMSLVYPDDGIAGYSREAFIEDLLHEHVREVRGCLDQRAYKVQIDFIEASLALRLDRSGILLASFVDLNNLALARFSDGEREHLGVHACCTVDGAAAHDVALDYAVLIPNLFQLNVCSFYLGISKHTDRPAILKLIRQHMKPDHRVFIGVTAPNDPRIETAEEVRDRVIEAARFIPPEQLGTTDDCGFAPFFDDRAISRDTAFAKIRARIQGSELACEILAARGT
jgi:5-methyltetrahydropteroyltriglutamate--homocysteine methyltransferase